MRRAMVVVLLGTVAAGCTAAPPATVPVPAAAPVGEQQALPVYYVATTSAGARLQREFHRVATSDPVSDAVREMFGVAARDPDYRTYWPAGAALRAPVVAGPDVITVDLTAQAAGAPTGATPEMSLQQLVFTVQGAARSTLPVRLLMDGKPAQRVLGGIAVAAPVPRGDVYALRSLVQIDSPADGATTGQDVVVSGEAAVFEATVPWEVRRGTAVVASGVTSTSEGQVFAPFTFSVTLAPGEYELRISEDDLSDGAGRPVLTDTKTITVRGWG